MTERPRLIGEWIIGLFQAALILVAASAIIPAIALALWLPLWLLGADPAPPWPFNPY